MKDRKRPYVQTVRSQQQEQTRQKIVEALVALHQEIGPKNTTIAAVAKRAGVQRLTVYRHFADEKAMLEACSGHWIMHNPPPTEENWVDQDSPQKRVFAALLAIHQYYSRTEVMLAKVYRDASEMEALAEIMKGFDDHFKAIADNLASDLAKKKPDKKLKALSRHLVRFSTWQSLSKDKLSAAEIAELGSDLLSGRAD